MIGMSEEMGVLGEESDFDIRTLAPEDVEPVLGMLNQTFNTSFDQEWVEWKHRRGPWGPSPGWVAHDDRGLVGVRLFLPWRLTESDRVHRALRPCDTVTASRARGRGVFRALTEHAVRSVEAEADLLFNTPNPNSRPGYLKMGFVEGGVVDQRVGLVRPRKVDVSGRPVPPASESGLRTQLDSSFLTWRYEDCPTTQYWLFGLPRESGNGLVCRLRRWKGMRLMVVSEVWGDVRQRASLLAGAAHEMGARLAWMAEPLRGSLRISAARPGTLVTRYDLRSDGENPPGDIALSLGDIEDVL
jgi:GNAT superfamily N-acetyltransferase